MSKFIYFLIPLFIFACKQKTANNFEYTQVTGKAQGSTYSIIYENSVNRNLKPAFDSLLKNIDNSLSIYNENSLISRINTNDNTAEPDKIFLDALQQSLKVWKESDGYFDITVNPLVKAWGFGPSKKETISKQKIDTLLNYVGMDKVIVQGNSIIKKNPRVQFDMNAIAQGYTVDYISEYLDSLEIKNYLVEVGGEVKAKGKSHKNKPWNVGIDKPNENAVPGEQLQAIIPLSNKSLATSGNYRKFYIENGIKYSHTIDPFTGYPVKNNLLSVTIIANNCSMADAYATACMAMGLTKAKTFVESKRNIEAYFVYSNKSGNFEEYITPGIQKIILR